MRPKNFEVIQAVVIFSTAMLVAVVHSGCGHVAGESQTKTVTVGEVSPNDAVAKESDHPIVATSHAAEDSAAASSDPGTTASTAEADSAKKTESAPTAVPETRTFKVEGPESALRISYDDFDLLKVMNLDPVPPDAPERMPKWLKELDGKRIRVRGFMYPPFQDKDIRGFILARDNQICCFGRTPKEYDLIDVFMRSGVTTHYIQNRPFDVVGVFKIKSEIEKFTAMYELEDAVVIEK